MFNTSFEHPILEDKHQTCILATYRKIEIHVLGALRIDMKQKYHNEAAIDSNLGSLAEFGT
jgi:hypothetical protein